MAKIVTMIKKSRKVRVRRKNLTRIVCRDTKEIFYTYKAYLRGKHWENFRVRFRASKYSRGCCLVCSTPRLIQLHHTTYDRVGRERLTDVVELCKKCHKQVHRALKRNVTWEHILEQLDGT